MQRGIRLVLASALPLGLVACGGGGPTAEDDLSQDEAEQAFDTAYNSAEQGTDAAQSSFTQNFAAQPQDVEDLDMDVDCLGGGTASFEGSMDVPGLDGDGATEMDFDLAFDNCTEDGITMDGELSMWMRESSDFETGEIEMSQVMDGVIDFSGEIEGSCAMDLEVHVSMSFPDGGFGDIDIEIEESGTFCGYSLEELETEAFDEDSFGDGGGDGGGGDNGNGNGDNGNGGDDQCVANDPGGEPCDGLDDCTVTCICETGTVDRSSCYLGFCEYADDKCEEACDAYGGYTGEFCGE